MSLNPPDPPKIPDYSQIANQQTAANTTSGAASQSGSLPEQFNQYGSVTHQQIGTDPTTGTPLYATNTNLSPQQQSLFDTLQGTKQIAGTAGQQVLGAANFGANPAGPTIGGMTSGITQGILDKEVGFLNPYFTTERDQLDNKLRNQGLFPGQPGYDVAMRGLDTTHAGTVQDFLAKSEPQAFQQAKSTYEEPLSVAGTLAGMGAPGDPTQNLVNTAPLNIQPANVVGAAANQQDAAMKAYTADQAKYSSMMSGLMGIPTAVLGGWAKGGFPGASAIGSSLGTAATGGMDALASLGPAALAMI